MTVSPTATRRLVAEGGAAAFYRGPIGAALVGLMEAHGGLITADDLAEYTPLWSDCLSIHCVDTFLVGMDAHPVSMRSDEGWTEQRMPKQSGHST